MLPTGSMLVNSIMKNGIPLLAVLVCTGLSLLTGGGQAANRTWFGGAGSYTAAGNWTGTVMPTSTDTGFITGGTATVFTGSSAVTGGLNVSSSGMAPVVLQLRNNAFLNLLNSFNLGTSGNADLLVEYGGRLRSGSAIVASGSSSKSTVTITGSWGSGNLAVGGDGQATMTINSLGEVASQAVTIANTTGVSSSATVLGSWSMSSLTIGNQGNGALAIQGGGTVTASSVVMGVGGSSSGSLNLNGTAGSRGTFVVSQITGSNGAHAVEIDGGILRARGANADFLKGFGVGEIIFSGGGAYLDTNGFAVGVVSPLDGVGALTKQGQGVLTLTGNNTFSGGLVVESGAVLANSPAGSATGFGGVTIATGGTLGGIGRIAPQGSAAILAQANSVVSPGMSGAGTLTIDLGNTTGGATFAAGSKFAFEVQSGGANMLSFLNASAGDVVFNTNGLGLKTSGATTEGTHTIFSFDAPSAYTGTLVEPGKIGNGLSGRLVYETSRIDLEIYSEVAYWNVTGTNASGDWDTATANWSLAPSGSGASTTWQQGYNAVFSAADVSSGSFRVGLKDDVSVYYLTYKGGAPGSELLIASDGGSISTAYSDMTLSIDAGTSLKIAAPVTGTGRLIKTGEGLLSLTGSNSYAGIEVDGGTLVTDSVGLKGSVINDATLVLDQQTSGTFSGVISGTGAIRVTGPGLLTLKGQNTFTGGITVEGRLSLGNDKALGNSELVTMADGAALANSFGTGFSITRPMRWEGDFTYLGSPSSSYALYLQSSISLPLESTLTVQQGALLVQGTMAERAPGSKLIKSGTGTLWISGSSSYTGGTEITEGLVIVSNQRAFGTGDVILQSGTLQLERSYNINNHVSYRGGIFEHKFDAPDAISGTQNAMMAGSLDATSHLTGGVDTSASILAGQWRYDDFIAGLLKTSFSAAWEGFNDNFRFSDVYKMGGENGTRYVLELSAAGVTLDGYIAYFDDTTDGWVSAFDAVTQPTATIAQQNYEGSFESFQALYGTTLQSYMGAWGIDPSTKAAWAVLDVFGNFSLIAAPVELVLGANNQSMTYTEAITDNPSYPVSILKEGTGTATLLGANTYTGGTTIAAGMLKIGNDGVTGTLPGDVVNNGVLAFARKDAYAFGGDIAGTGEVRQMGSGTLTLSGNLTGSGSVRLQKGGLILNGNNDYTGGTIALAGMLGLGSETALGSGPLTLAGKVILDNVSGHALSLDNDLQYWNADFTFAGSDDMEMAKVSAVMNGSRTVTVEAGELGIAGIISSTKARARLTKAGAGKLTLTGANTYDGGTRISGGVLEIGEGGSLGSGKVQNEGTLIANPSTTMSIGNAISGRGQVQKSGAGFLTLSATNTHTGGLVVNEGKVILGNARAFGASRGSLAVNGGELDLNGFNLTVGAMSGTGGAIASGVSGTVTLTTNSVANSRFDGNLEGGVSLVKLGKGILGLGGTNTHSGGTKLVAGGLDLLSPGALGAGPLTIAGTAILDNTSGAPLTLTTNNTLNGNANFTFRGTNDLNLGTGNVILGGLRTVTVSANSLTLGGEIVTAKPSVTLTKSGSGRLILAGDSHYQGATVVKSGTLQIGAGGITGSLASKEIKNSGVVAFDRSDAAEYAGVISGKGSVQQNGGGTLTLSGKNTQTGGVFINGGTFLVGHEQALGKGSVMLDSGTLGAVPEIIAINVEKDLLWDSDARIALTLGGSPAKVAINGGLQLLDDGIFTFDFATALTHYTDQVFTVMSVAEGFGSVTADRFAYVSSNMSLTGSFIIQGNDLLFALPFTVHTLGGSAAAEMSGTQAVPEPGVSLLVMMGGLALLAGGRGRRRATVSL